MKIVTSLSGARRPMEEIVVGDKVCLYGMTYFTVEWLGHRIDGGLHMAGVKNDGDAHVSSLSAGAMVSRVFALEEHDE